MIRDIRAYRKQLDERNKRLQKRHITIKENLEFINSLQHPDVFVKVDGPDPSLLEDYRKQSVGYREFMFASSLHGAAIIEGARQANHNLEKLGMLQLDMAQIEAVTKDVSKLAALWTLLANTNIPDELRAKTYEFAAASVFGPGHAQNNIAEVFRNLSLPERQPYGVSSMLRISDPDFKKKYAEINGKPPQQINVVKPGSIPRIDELAQEAKRNRKERISKRQ
jgi:hypothetical protein